MRSLEGSANSLTRIAFTAPNSQMAKNDILGLANNHRVDDLNIWRLPFVSFTLLLKF